jgi:hypothetical protein
MSSVSKHQTHNGLHLYQTYASSFSYRLNVAYSLFGLNLHHHQDVLICGCYILRGINTPVGRRKRTAESSSAYWRKSTVRHNFLRFFSCGYLDYKGDSSFACHDRRQAGGHTIGTKTPLAPASNAYLICQLVPVLNPVAGIRTIGLGAPAPAPWIACMDSAAFGCREVNPCSQSIMTHERLGLD